MVRLLVLLMVPLFLFAAQVHHLRWEGGKTYLQFLQDHNLPLKPLYYNLDSSSQQAVDEIHKGVHYQILEDSNGTVEQVLIPINDELQIHIIRDKNATAFELIPIVSETKREGFVVTIKNSPYNDILHETHSKKLAQIFMDGFKKSINFKRGIHKGDKVVMVYEQKYRFGHPFSMPTLYAGMIQLRKKRHFVYDFKGNYYNKKGQQIRGYYFIRPVKGGWISSGFSLRRWQPVLHIYRPHFGVDYAVVVGTPIHATASGRVIFVGKLRGYGNVIKIRHDSEYMTLYAHQKRFARGIRRGKWVKQGQVIGYVGLTGITTGAHLHFGVYRYRRAINPLHVVQKTTKHLRGKRRKEFFAYKKKMNVMIRQYLQDNTPPPVTKLFKPLYYLNNKRELHLNNS